MSQQQPGMGMVIAMNLAKKLRSEGVPVREEGRDAAKLCEQLSETLRRVKAGEAMGELSRRDPEALCALAQTRPLEECESHALLARVRYYEGLIRALQSHLETAQAWSKEQELNATLWGRTCDKLGGVVALIAEELGDPSLDLQLPQLMAALRHRLRQSVASHEAADRDEALRKVAEVVGQPGLEATPERLAYVVAEYVECLRTERMPDDAELRELVRIAAGMSAGGRRRIRELADLSTSVAEGLDGAIRSVVNDWADADFKDRL
jgi:hypothetical protein